MHTIWVPTFTHAAVLEVRENMIDTLNVAIPKPIVRRVCVEPAALSSAQLAYGVAESNNKA